MEWLNGVPILLGDLQGIRQKGDINAEREEITTLLCRVFFQQLYIDGFFHADPHPGNLFYLKDGRIALLDCGMVGRLDPRTQQNLTEMLHSINTGNGRICSAEKFSCSRERFGENAAQVLQCELVANELVGNFL
jgi:predicted unusual protein kinase regulating ubiquinone biosynthesis (AarF/ABC1/UbiB family)